MKALKVILLLLAVFLALFIAGFAILFFSSPTLGKEEARTLTKDYLAQVHLDPESAYAASSSVFKEKFSFEDLGKVVSMGDFDRVKDFEVTNTNISKAAYDSERGSAKNATTIEGQLIWMDGSTITASFTWGLEEEIWKLEDFTFFSDTYVPAGSGEGGN